MPNFDSIKELNLSGKLAVFAGGTQGIGAGIARLCASLNATVAVIGRNATLGAQVVEELRAAGKDETADHAFIFGDFVTVKGTKAAADRVKEWTGGRKIAYLFMSQGRASGGEPWTTDDGLDDYFALESSSRFVLAYTLVQADALAKDATVVSIANAGHGGDKVDLDNLDFKGKGALEKMTNRCDVVDCFTKELTIRYAPLRAVHLFPGLVKTNVFANSGTPWYFRYLFNIIYSIPFLGVTADQYAVVALWIAASDEAKSETDELAWSEYGLPVKMSAAAKDDAVRAQVWDKLVAIAEGKK